MDNTPEKLLKHRNSFANTFTTFKNDIHHIIDDTKNIIIDVEEIGDDFKHCCKKCYLKGLFKNICCFWG